MKIILAVDFDPIKLGCRIVDLDNNKAQSYCFVKVVDTAYTDAQAFIDACLPNFEDFEDKERYFKAVDRQVGYDSVMSLDTINSKASCGDVDHIIYFDPSALRWEIRDTMDGCVSSLKEIVLRIPLNELNDPGSIDDVKWLIKDMELLFTFLSHSTPNNYIIGDLLLKQLDELKQSINMKEK